MEFSSPHRCKYIISGRPSDFDGRPKQWFGSRKSLAITVVLVQMAEAEHNRRKRTFEDPKCRTLTHLFKGCHFDREIIILCVRWYLRFKLSFRDLVEMIAERGISLAHTTIMRWIQRYVPEFEKRLNRFACRAGALGASTKPT